MIETTDSQNTGAKNTGATVQGSDRDLRHRVKRFLSTRGIRGIEDVRVGGNGGTVVLRGRVTSNHDRWLCHNCASRVAGVLRVIDELEVDNEARPRKRRPR